MSQNAQQQDQEAAPRLDGKTICILVTDGFEQVELTGPRAALEEAGARTVIVAPQAGQVQGFNHVDKADRFDVEQTLDTVRAADFDALLLPGGVVNADTLRADATAQAFAKAIDGAGKPVAVICHGAWLLVSANLAGGRTLTSWPSLQDDLRNAGAIWVDKEVVSDRNWTSSRKPADIPAFNRAILAAIAG